VPYTWDARGNLTGDGVFTYTYSAAGQLVRAQSVTATLGYTYTADGLRVAQSSNGVGKESTLRLYDGGTTEVSLVSPACPAVKDQNLTLESNLVIM